MRIKKSMGKIYGAEFTKAEEKAFNMEVERQLAEWNMEHDKELTAMSLWILHEEFGFGPERLKKFFMNFYKDIYALNARYLADEGENDLDSLYLCQMKIKEYGIDLDAWERELLP